MKQKIEFHHKLVALPDNAHDSFILYLIVSRELMENPFNSLKSYHRRWTFVVNKSSVQFRTFSSFFVSLIKYLVEKNSTESKNVSIFVFLFPLMYGGGG